MRERPILFSAPMVRAILDGRKTLTRRVMKPQPVMQDGWVGGGYWQPKPTPAHGFPERFCLRDILPMCPYGQPGDRLWVRECFSAWWVAATGKRSHVMGYRADINDRDWDGFGADDPWWLDAKWEPSIHMPRSFSRITLEIVSVRVERLQDISDDDAQAEGCTLSAGVNEQASRAPYRVEFFKLWESINGPDSWSANPWVWVVEFKRVTP